MSQKALIIPEALAAFTVSSRPIPKPGPGELLIKIKAAALNPIDWLAPGVSVFISDYPAVLGCDSAGTVEEIGEGVTGFYRGDEVFHQTNYKNDYAGFQQYTLVPAEITAKKPSSISFDEAASIPLTLATAMQGFYGDRKSPDIFRLPPSWEVGNEQAAKGKTVVVLGGSSSVGQFAIQLAKLSGFSSIISTASLHNKSLLESLGASGVVDRNASNLREEITKAANSSPIDVVFDAVSLDDTQQVGWDVLAPGGTLVLVKSPKIDRQKYSDKKVVDDVFGSVYTPRLRSLGVSLYKALPGLIEAGKIKPNHVEVLPGGLNGIVGGLERLKANKVSGVKLTVHPQETV